jgi:hypothetical protein
MLYTVQADLGDYSDALEPTLKLPGMDKVAKLDWNGRTTGEGIPWVGSGKWEVEPVDLVVTFRNYHNFRYDDRIAMFVDCSDRQDRQIYVVVQKALAQYCPARHPRESGDPASQGNCIPVFAGMTTPVQHCLGKADTGAPGSGYFRKRAVIPP